MLEPYEGKLSCTVLRGEGGSNALDLPDVQKQGDFFVESPIILFAAIIWYLRIYKNGQVLYLPSRDRVPEQAVRGYFHDSDLLPGPRKLPFAPLWMPGWEELQDQLQGQIASAKIPLSRMISPQLYWVMSGDDFTLDINNPERSENPLRGKQSRQAEYLRERLSDLYNSRIVKLINKKGQLKSSIIIDELPTIYLQGY